MTSKTKTDIQRRKFLKTAGLSVGAAAVAGTEPPEAAAVALACSRLARVRPPKAAVPIFRKPRRCPWEIVSMGGKGVVLRTG